MPGVRRLVLWDVDGTLLHHGGIGADVFDSAIEEVLGVRPAERVKMSGKTDPQIVAEYLAQDSSAGRGGDGAAERILAAVETHLARAAREGVLARDGALCPGVETVLASLAARPGVAQAPLTGNIRPNAVLKVAAFGLERYLDFDLGAYGSDDADRNALVPVALGRLAARGTDLAASEVWVVGDTPRDLACARAAGARCLLVATGGYRYPELAPLGADATLPDLSDTEAVVDLLTA